MYVYAVEPRLSDSRLSVKDALISSKPCNK